MNGFLKAVQIEVKLINLSKEGLALVSNQEGKPFVYFRAERKMVKVQLDDILYRESMKDYIKVITPTGIIITWQSISPLVAKLPESHFIRTHHSFIIPSLGSMHIQLN